MKVILKNLTKQFPNKKTKEPFTAVDNLDVELPDGKLIGLLGPSGCGKSTTLFMISGLEEPTSGSIIFGDKDVTNVPVEKREIGLVFQNYALYPHFTVLQNIMFPLKNMKVPKDEAYNRAVEAAKLVQIESCLDKHPNEMSGGQQQRVAIARALVKRPDILLLDEPLSNLDARLRLQTREEIRRIQQETNITTIFVTHDQEEAMSICDTILLMKNGKLQQMGIPQDIYDNPKNLFVAEFLGNPPINTFEGVIKDKKIYINDEYLMDYDAFDQEVYVSVRPEGFIVKDDGKLSMNVRNIQVMGRDISIICENKASTKPTVRIILTSDENIEKKDIVHVDVKPLKTFVFNKETQERI